MPINEDSTLPRRFPPRFLATLLISVLIAKKLLLILASRKKMAVPEKGIRHAEITVLSLLTAR